MSGRLSRQAFVDQMGSVFTVVAEGDMSVKLSLVEVKDLGSRQSGAATIETYALLFEGPLEPQLAESTFQFLHPEMGELVIFIVPLDPLEGSMRYEAIFN